MELIVNEKEATDLKKVIDKQTRRYIRRRVNLMREPALEGYAGLLMLGDSRVQNILEIPWHPRAPETAYTDGWNTRYHPEFMATLTDKEMCAVIIHEVHHVAFRHLSIWRKLFLEDARRANMAADYVANLIIHDIDPEHKFMELPKSALLDERFRGMDTRQVYNILRKESKEDGDGSGFDSHIVDGEGQEGDSVIPENAQEIIDQAMRIAAGRSPGSPISRMFQAAEANVDWVDVLSPFVQEHSTGGDDQSWKRLSKRFMTQDVYMPGSISEEVGCVVMAIDTSGSIETEELSRAVYNVQSAMDNMGIQNLEMLYWDTEVAGHETYERGETNIVQNTKPVGGGGTDVACVFEYIKEKMLAPQVAIVITDGWTDFPEFPPDYPVLWCMTTDQKAPWGHHVRVRG